MAPAVDPKFALMAELLVAQAGVIDPSFTEAVAREAETLLQRMSARIRSWLKRSSKEDEELREWVPPTEREDRRVRDDLASVPESDDRMRERTELAGLPPGVPQLVTLVLVRCRQHLVDVYPSIVIDNGLGPDEPALGFCEREEWLGRLEVVHDPMRLVKEVEMGTLSQEQADSFRHCFPLMLAELETDAKAELGELRFKAEKEGKRIARQTDGDVPPPGLPEEKDVLLGTLFGMRPLNQVPPPPPAEPAEDGDRTTTKPKEQATATERTGVPTLR